jgi:hypothetical protein
VEVTLPSGATVTVRDKLTAKDKFTVQAAVRLSLDTNTGMQESSGSFLTDLRNALLKEIITSWSFTWPVPSAGGSLDDLDLDDYNALSDGVEDLLTKVMANPNRRAPSSS